MKKVFVVLMFFVLSGIASAAEIGMRLNFGSSSSTSVSGSPLFSGSADRETSPEVFVRASIIDLLPEIKIPRHVFVEANLGLGDSVSHEILFAGASLGRVTCGQALGVGVGAQFPIQETKWRAEAAFGFEHKSCSGEYMVGGTPVANQKRPDRFGTVVRVGAMYQFSPKAYAGGGLKCVSDTTSGASIMGNTVEMRTGGCGLYGGAHYLF